MTGGYTNHYTIEELVHSPRPHLLAHARATANAPPARAAAQHASPHVQLAPQTLPYTLAPLVAVPAFVTHRNASVLTTHATTRHHTPPHGPRPRAPHDPLGRQTRPTLSALRAHTARTTNARKHSCARQHQATAPWSGRAGRRAAAGTARRGSFRGQIVSSERGWAQDAKSSPTGN